MSGKTPSAKAPVTKTPDMEDQVRLKPVLGIRPGVYLTVIYSIVIFLILFFVLLYPGITRPGSVVVFTSEPSGAALKVDGVYMGTSPARVFVPKGDHTMEMTLPGFDGERIECAVPGRLFASKLFPRRYILHSALQTANPAAALALGVSDYAAWTFGGEPTPSWQVPLSLSEGVYRIGGAAASADTADILAASARFAVTRAALRDLVRAKNLASSGGVSPSPLTLARSVSEIAAFLADNPSSAAWLADTLPADSAAVLIASGWYQKQLAAFAEVTALETLAPLPENTPDSALPVSQIRVGGLLFTGMASGVLVQGEPFPHRVPVDSFFIGTTEVPPPAYADFLDANPLWKVENREALEKQGYVNSEYLADFDEIVPGGNRAGVNAVSWFAASAFCEWLDTKLPDFFSDWEIRLPTEAEWEYAAKSARKWGAGIIAPNSVWEWCADPFSQLPIFAAPSQAVTAAGSPERSLRRGAWPNAAMSTSLETRASLPPASCSPFVSFRPVIARKSGVR